MAGVPPAAIDEANGLWSVPEIEKTLFAEFIAED